MVIFDMAGTTINDYNLSHRTLQKAFRELGLQIELGEVLQHAGKDALEAIKDILNLCRMDGTICARRIYEHYRASLFTEYAGSRPCAFDSVGEVLAILRANDVQIVLNTVDERATALRLIRKMGWHLSGDFDLLVTPADLGDRFPDPISFAMEQLQVSVAGQVVRVGGSMAAIEQGKNAGCGLSIGITTGAQTFRQLKDAGPDHILEDMSGLIELMFCR